MGLRSGLLPSSSQLRLCLACVPGALSSSSPSVLSPLSGCPAPLAPPRKEGPLGAEILRPECTQFPQGPCRALLSQAWGGPESLPVALGPRGPPLLPSCTITSGARSSSHPPSPWNPEPGGAAPSEAHLSCGRAWNPAPFPPDLKVGVLVPLTVRRSAAGILSLGVIPQHNLKGFPESRR